MKSVTAAGQMPAQSVYARVTQQVLRELENGTAPWRKPWRAEFGLPRNLDSRKPYRGVNVLLLMSSALSAGYGANWWCTYQQAQKLGGHVNRGEHGFTIVFYQRTPVDAEEDEPEQAAAGKRDARYRPVLKTYVVFNAVGQCSGIAVPEAPRPAWQPVEAAESIAEAMSVPVRYCGAEAFYQPARDLVTMPPRSCFDSATGFYSTLLHELVHATGHESRLDRPFDFRGTEGYAWEEVVAEMGSAMLSAIVGIPSPDFGNTASYVDHWRKRMQRDPQAVCEAAAAAQKAVEWLLMKAGLASAA